MPLYFLNETVNRFGCWVDIVIRNYLRSFIKLYFLLSEIINLKSNELIKIRNFSILELEKSMS